MPGNQRLFGGGCEQMKLSNKLLIGKVKVMSQPVLFGKGFPAFFVEYSAPENDPVSSIGNVSLIPL
jgi:hypothetical protein